MDGFVLDGHKKVYFAGIGGVSMSALALILRARGIEVLGYDRSHSHETEILEEHGVDVDYSEDSPKLENVDLLVYTAALKLTHPVIQKALDLGIECISRAVMLGAIVKTYGISIGVAGTHGKSTTSGMISRIFDVTPGHDPSFAVGALLPFVNAYYKVGTDGTFVFEADEYKNSFLQFFPTTAVALNVCHDHPDFFKDLDAVVISFSEYISHSANAVLNLDSEGAVRCAEGYKGNAVWFSAARKADYYATDIKETKGYASYTLHYPQGEIRIELSVPGLHNVSNSLAAFAACHINGLTPEEIAAGIRSFTGVSRRFEHIGILNGADVISDYAHHPDEIAATLTTAKKVAEGRVITVFQPHTYSRLAELYEGFKKSLCISDVVAVTDVFSARETDTLGVSGESLANACGGTYVPSFEAAAGFLKETARPGDLVIIMGAGDIYKVWDELKKSS
ncbi:MAG: UDP-N-acetylmuramate--L-alanine ligase [Clostridia bacterium]|nr:UDP-N-acetylmuramate--L-alanine ligase [Clostridia bacterium]